MLLLALKIQVLQGTPFLLLIFFISCLVGEKVVEKSRNRRKDNRHHSNLSEVYCKFIYSFFFSVFFSATKQILCNTNFLFYLILEEIFWCGVLCWCMVWRSLLTWHSLMIDDNESEVRVRATRETERRREKKLLNIKCKCYYNLTYMHSYCSNCTFMHNFTPTNVGIFLIKICKIKEFFIFVF